MAAFTDEAYIRPAHRQLVTIVSTANQAVEKTMQELQELRREAASSIVIPETGGGMGGLGGAGGPGGKIQLR
jgi:hypothetical protein